MKPKSIIIFAILILSIITAKLDAQSLTWLGTLGGNTSGAADVSNDGTMVVGAARDSTGKNKAFVWQHSTGLISLGTLGGFESGASGVSEGGRIIGTALDSLGRSRAFVYINGVMHDLDPFRFTDTYARDISPQGSIIVGSYKDNNSYNKAFYYAGAGLSDIGTLGGETNTANAISGGIDPITVGISQTSNFEFHAFKSRGNLRDDLGTLGGKFSSATDISKNQNYIVGYSNGTNHNDHAFIWTDSSGMQDLGTLGGSQSWAYSVSDNGVTVGYSYTQNGLENAFIWTPNLGMKNLNDIYSNLIPSTGKLTYATSISADGRYIVGTGYQSNPEKYEAFLLDRGTTTRVNEHAALPNDFSLEQNYPNPFNPSTKIHFTIPASSLNPFSKGEGILVSLKIYDVLGNEVATLVNEEKPAGVYEVTFDASELSSGIYFYRIAIHSDNLSTGAFTETRKMMIMK
jgi:probable HAF family extracellular repeat protein